MRAAWSNTARRSIHRALSRQPSTKIDPRALLSNPTWDPATYLPSQADITSPANRLTPSKLHHLLRLSALPLPATKEEETELLNALAAQLHFVRQVRSADTAGVVELSALRDETTEASEAEQTATRELLERVVAKEERKGRYAPKIRRRKVDQDGDTTTGAGKDTPEDWDMLGNAARKQGGYFVVRREKV